MRDTKLFLEDIIQSIDHIDSFIAGISYEEFILDEKTSSAVIRHLEIIGEASKNIPDSIRTLYTDIPWKNMAGLRDRLIHGYFGISHKIIWSTCKNFLPQIKFRINEIIQSIES